MDSLEIIKKKHYLRLHEEGIIRLIPEEIESFKRHIAEAENEECLLT